MVSDVSSTWATALQTKKRGGKPHERADARVPNSDNDEKIN